MLCNKIWWKVAWHHVAHMSIDIIILSVFLTFHLKVHFVSCLFISSLSFRLSLLFVQYGMLQTCFQLPEKYQIPIKWLRFTNLTFLREFKEEKFLVNPYGNDMALLYMHNKSILFKDYDFKKETQMFQLSSLSNLYR